MADNDQLSADQKKKAIDWLNQKAPNLTCPSCHQKSFVVADHMVAPSIYRGGGLVIGGTNYPLVLVVCTNCAHVLHYSAVASGVLAPASKETVKASAEAKSDD